MACTVTLVYEATLHITFTNVLYKHQRHHAIHWTSALIFTTLYENWQVFLNIPTKLFFHEILQGTDN